MRSPTLPFSLILLCSLLAAPRCGPAPCEPVREIALPGFLFGFSQGRASLIELSTGIGANAVRPTLSWRTVEATVVAEGLTMPDVMNAAHVSAWAATRDWSAHDAAIAGYVAAGLYPIPIVGHGFSSTLPRLGGVPAAPDVLGPGEYLARQYRYTRAVVERYDGDGVDDAPDSPRVEMWQIENELNQALLTGVFGWREPTLFDVFTSSWADRDFVNALLITLSLAVHQADPTALTMTNLHSDVGAGITDFFAQPSWNEWLEFWNPWLDVIGLDAYPNYYRSTPPDGAAVGARVAELRALSCGRPVIVVETGYPTGPAERGYDEAKQDAYLEEALSSAVAAGASGFLWFGSETADTHDVVITQEDVDNLAFLGDTFASGNALALLNWAVANLDYVEGHFAEVVQSVEPYWGVVAPDGTTKPAWDRLVAFGADLPALPSP